MESEIDQRLVAGCMTGTSLDGIDAALVRIDGVGLQMRAEIVAHHAAPLGDLREPLAALHDQQPMAAREIAQLALDFSALHVRVIRELMARTALTPNPSPKGRGELALTPNSGDPSRHGGYATPKGRGELDLICVHGQTVVHDPPLSWQLMNPAPIARAFKCPVIFDLRAADLAAGGQGAPITPLADWIMFRCSTHSRAIINLGGFCNITILPADENDPLDALARIRGFDLCPCNKALDATAQQAIGQPFDASGSAATRGRVHDDRLSGFPQFGDRSLGTGDEATQWVAALATLPAEDQCATAAEGIAQTIARSLQAHRVDEVLVAGGGAHHLHLVQRIAAHLNKPVERTDAYGVPIEAREAMAMAILGALCADGIPITLPQVTGCAVPAPLAGSWCNPPHAHGMFSAAMRTTLYGRRDVTSNS